MHAQSYTHDYEIDNEYDSLHRIAQILQAFKMTT